MRPAGTGPRNTVNRRRSLITMSLQAREERRNFAAENFKGLELAASSFKSCKMKSVCFQEMTHKREFLQQSVFCDTLKIED